MSQKNVILLILALAIGVGIGRAVFSTDDGAAAPGTLPELTIVDEMAHGVSHILIRVDKNRTRGQGLKLARLAYEALRAGTPFADVAKGRSEDASAPDGGFLGFVPSHHETAFAGAVQALMPGGTSPPLATQRGWQIVKRHTFAETVELERKLWIPTHGFYVAYGEIPGGEGRTKEQAYAIAKDMLVKLGAGQITLEDARRQFSNEPNPPPEAFLRMTANRPYSREVYEALRDEEPGRIIGPLDTSDGWGVLVRGRYMRAFVRHILIQHGRSVRRADGVTRAPEAARDLAERALEEALTDRAQWDALVERYSDDAQSRGVSGAMGIMGPGIMPPGFEKYLYDTPPGSICKSVIETPFGYHVVWRVN